MDESKKSLDPRSLGEMIRKRKWFLLLPLVIILPTAWFFIERMPNVYRVESTLLFDSRDPLRTGFCS